jgi:[ribosomal protein S5]-alanine N-acetyltransferase
MLGNLQMSIDNMHFESVRLSFIQPSIDYVLDAYEMAKDPKVKEYTGGITKLSIEKYRKIYESFVDSFGKNNRYIFSIIEKAGKDYIGYCGFQFCDNLKSIEILYGINRNYWGNGFAKEAALETLKYGFNVLNFESIYAAVNPNNVASEKILKSIGLNYCGNIEWPNQGIVHKYGLSKKEFYDRNVCL